MDPWFLDQIEGLIDAEVDIAHRGLDGLDAKRLRAEAQGFSDTPHRPAHRHQRIGRARFAGVRRAPGDQAG
ncbi:hypothetical protein [Thermomonas sp.]|uniref:hypothetical protein n=1 Tax=Thermomonas sp. TaxID=1971895 RepID=UPI0025CDCA12|nr:hypothetical protein [Thermomonas sp.]